MNTSPPRGSTLFTIGFVLGCIVGVIAAVVLMWFAR
jgi:hypothetical protein